MKCRHNNLKFLGEDTKYSCGFDESISWKVKQYKYLDCGEIIEKAIDKNENSSNDHKYNSADEYSYFYL